MDTKQTALLRDIHDRITAGTFGEIEVHSLVCLMREDSQDRSALRELGDLLAHRRRSEGRVQEYMRRVNKQAADFVKAGGVVPPPELIFTETQINDALNAGLRRHGLAPFSQERDPNLVPTAQARSRQVQLVILSLLQRVALQYLTRNASWPLPLQHYRSGMTSVL